MILSPSEVNDEGRRAFATGVERAGNPYPQASAEHEMWDAGWCDAETAGDVDGS